MQLRRLPLLMPALASFSLLASAQETIYPETQAADMSSGIDRAAVLQSLPPDAFTAASRQLLFDEPGDGTLWVRGENYKASFGSDGFTIMPLLGDSAPRNFPVRLDLSRVTQGDAPMELAARSSLQRTGRQVTQARGCVTERYHIAERTTEQTFVFDELPSAGALVLHLAVETELDVRPNGSGGWTFGNEYGSVDYGAATAIDAAGQILALEQRWADGGIEIVVPASFVSQVVLPLVVDPVLSFLTVANDATTQHSVDAAYDPQNDLFMIAFEQSGASFLDRDVISAFYNPSLGLVTSFASIDISSARWSEPKVADCYFDEVFLCVASVGDLIGARQVRGRTRAASTGSTGAQFVIGPGLSDDAFPDVGGFGNDTPTSFDFCVVWQRSNMAGAESDIVSQGVSSGGSLIGPVVNIANVNGQTEQKPSISQSSGPTTLLSTDHRYMVAWERVITPTDRNLWARVVEFDNDIAGHPRFLAYSFSDSINVDVSMQASNSILSPDPYWVLVYERLLGSDYDIFTVVADNDSADNARSVTAMQDVAIQDEQSQPKIAFDGSHYLVAYNTEAPGGGADAYLTALNVVSDGSELRTGLSDRREPLRALDGGVQELAITSNWFGSSVGFPHEGLVVWVAPVGAGSNPDVGGALVQELTAVVGGSQYCEASVNSTGRSAWVCASAFQQSPMALMELRCQDLPQNQFALFLTALGNSVTANPGGSSGNLCLSGEVGRFTNQVGSTGPAGQIQIFVDLQNLPQPTGNLSAMSGQTWYFQCWTRDFVGGAPTSNFSNGIGMSFL